MEVEGKKKKNNVGLIITIIVLIMVILLLGGYIIYINMPSNSNNVGDKDNTVNKVSEKVIDDTLLERDLSSKVTYLLSSYYKIDEVNDKNIILGYGFRSNVLSNQLTEDDKFYIAYSNLYNVASEITYTDNIKVDSGLISNNSLNGEKEIPVRKVEDMYFDLFGETLRNRDLTSNCPGIYFDSTNSKYYYLSACGGTSDRGYFIYKNKFSVKEDEAYVYLNIGMSTREGLYTEVIDSSDLSNYEDKKFAGVSDLTNFSINDENKDSFSEYKFIFKKNSKGIYSFKSVEKISK